jgi:murein L,D-transpeptidase YcbB/YkuD
VKPVAPARASRGVLVLLALVCVGAPATRSPAADFSGMRPPIALELAHAAYPYHWRLGPSGTQEALRAAYAHSDTALLWYRGGAPSEPARVLRERLQRADEYGLRPSDYVAPALEPATASMTGAAAEQRMAHLDVSLSAAALRFLADLHYGRVDPRAAGFELPPDPVAMDLGAVLDELAAGGDVDARLASLEPPFLHYRLLKQMLARYRRLALQPPVSLGLLPADLRHAIQPGEPFAGAPALRQWLRTLGDLGPARDVASETAPFLDRELAAALARFQARHGLSADGALGKSTLAALTTPLTQRVRQIELTLERWRWLPPFVSPPIIVNIPQFRLFAFRSTADRKADILQQDVIVGRTYPRMQTPVFAANLREVVFRPYWDVPYGITRREMLPHIRADAGFLAAQHLEIVAPVDDARAVPLPPTPANLAALTQGKLRLRQRPGADNALGLIKFVLPNRYDVYLHSTPAHGLFAESRRAFSHGCIRVADPVSLAVQLLRDTPGDWTRESIVAAMNGGQTRHVALATPVPVLIVYGTALATEAGEVLFFDDLYGQDRRLEQLLGLAPVR